MKLALGNSWSRVLEADRGEHAWLYEYVSCKNLEWLGEGPPDVQTFSMYNPELNLLASGLVPIVVTGAKQAGITLELVDERVCPAQAYPLADVSWLRDYQRGGLRAALSAKRGLIKAPTGSGKTEVAIAITRSFPDVEWLFLVHRLDLVDQFARRFMKRTNERAGTFTQRTWNRGTANVTASTFQSLHHAMQEGPHPNGIGTLIAAIRGLLIDEVHAQPADTYYAVTQGMNDAYYRFGFSGTPLNRDEKEQLRTLGAIGPVIYRIPTQLLIDRGILSRAHIRMVSCEQVASHLGATWRQVYKDYVTESDRRNDLIAEVCEYAEKPCMVFVTQLRHGRSLRTRLRTAGFKVDMAHGEDHIKNRQEKLKRMVDRSTDIIVATSIFQEGIDVPELRSVVNAAGGASEVAAIQRLGRGMRRGASKDHFELWDIFDHGQLWLERHSLARKCAYESEGHTVEMIT